ncbi:hypothetical protein ZWY2020_024072 [Hordeum vulgare]|nr:hypothetical protein ZWY2020_024072 [Hordeum vulgare]
MMPSLHPEGPPHPALPGTAREEDNSAVVYANSGKEEGGNVVAPDRTPAPAPLHRTSASHFSGTATAFTQEHWSSCQSMANGHGGGRQARRPKAKDKKYWKDVDQPDDMAAALQTWRMADGRPLLFSNRRVKNIILYPLQVELPSSENPLCGASSLNLRSWRSAVPLVL